MRSPHVWPKTFILVAAPLADAPQPRECTRMAQTPDFTSLIEAPDASAVRALVYLAWSDGILAEHEFDELRASLNDEPPATKAAAQPWLQHEQAPSIADLHRLRRQIRIDLENQSPVPPTPHQQAIVHTTTGLDLHHLQQNLVGKRATGTHTPQPLTDEERALSNELRLLIEGDSNPYWERVAETLREQSFRYLNAPSVEEHRDQVLQWLLTLAQEGYGKAFFSSDMESIDIRGMVNTFAALSTFDLNLVVKFGVQFGLFGGSIFFLGTAEHHRKLLPRIASGELLGGFAMTESGHGSDVKEIETTATWDPERKGFILHSPTRSSWKEWIGNSARDGRAMTVFAQLNIDDEAFGVHAFYVPVRDEQGQLLPGVHIEDCGHKMGLNGVDNGRIAFTQVFVPREHLLNRYGDVDENGNYTSSIRSESARFFTMLGTLIGGRMSVAFGAVTAARTALMIAVRYGASRRQFGPADAPERVILDYPTHRERLIPPLAHGIMYHLTLNDLLERYEARTENSQRHVESLAAGLKALCTWYAIDATQAAREGCGGQGYLSINKIAAIRKDVDVFATFEGDNVVLMNLLAKNSLTGYARSFQHDLAMSMIRELGRLANQAILERNPVLIRQTDEAHLRSEDYQLRALEIRADSLLSSAAKRVKKRTDQGMDPFEAFHDIQDHLQAMVRASMEHHTAQTAAAMIARCAEGPARQLLEQCRQLAAIDIIHKNAAWYLESGFIEAQKARAIRKLRMKIITELRSHALTLANAITYSEEALASPIAPKT